MPVAVVALSLIHTSILAQDQKETIQPALSSPIAVLSPSPAHEKVVDLKKASEKVF